MVEPGRLALTTTPSMFRSSREDTVPVSAAGPRFCAIAGGLVRTGQASTPMLAMATKDTPAKRFPYRLAFVIEPSRGGAAPDIFGHDLTRSAGRRVGPIHGRF